MPRRPQVENPKLLNQAFMNNELVKRAMTEKWSQWATTCGFQNFTDKIAEYLSENFDVEVMYNTELEAISISPDNRAKLTLFSTGESRASF